MGVSNFWGPLKVVCRCYLRLYGVCVEYIWGSGFPEIWGTLLRYL